MMADEMEYEDCVLKVNRTYAAKFQKQSEKAELDRCKYHESFDIQ